VRVSEPAQDPTFAPERARIVARMVALCELTFGISHGLNNALTAIVGEASFLQGESKDPAEIDVACGVILEQVDRCARMTRGILLRRPVASPARGECDLVRVIRDAEGLLRDALSRRVEIVVETPEEPLLLPLDPFDVETLLLLLVQRAARAGAGAVNLAVRARPGDAPEEAWLEVSVRPARVSPDGGWRSDARSPSADLADALILPLVGLLGARCEESDAPRELAARVRLRRLPER